jgi:hypothetical protein
MAGDERQTMKPCSDLLRSSYVELFNEKQFFYDRSYAEAITQLLANRFGVAKLFPTFDLCNFPRPPDLTSTWFRAEPFC